MLSHSLIFTDLDGTLLDHHTYSASPADELIEKLHISKSASVIPVTSKTQAELAVITDEIPFGDVIRVSENGSVIRLSAEFPNHNSLLVPGVSYTKIQKALTDLPPQIREQIMGFGDMDVDAICKHTGLSPDAAERAKARDATEPFLWSGSEEQMTELRSLMQDVGIQIQQGGRFFHLTGNATKAQAIETVRDLYRKQWPEKNFVSIALGDGPNDLEMIEGADYGAIIPNENGAAIFSNKNSVRVADRSGPNGWVNAVQTIMHELGLYPLPNRLS